MKVSFDFWNNYSFRSALLIIVVACLPFTGWLERFDWMIYDKISYWKQFIPDDQIVIIAIDEKSLQTIGRWPWSRRIHAELIDRLRQAGRNVVALDFLMAESDDNDPEGDRLLGLAIARHGAVVLPIAPIVEPDSQKISLVQPLPMFQRNALLGHVDVELDYDGVARRLFLFAGVNSPDWPALGYVLVRKAGGINAVSDSDYLIRSEINIPGTSDYWVRSHEVLIPFAGSPGTYPRISYERILNDDLVLQQLNNKIIIVGIEAIGLHSGFTTPVTSNHRLMSGIEWHANVVNMLHSGNTINPLAKFWIVFISIIWVLIALIGVNFIQRNKVIFLLMTVMALGMLLVWIMFDFFHVWIAPSAGLIGLILVYPLWSWSRINEFMQSLFITKTFSFNALESVGDGVITTDAESRIVYMNSEAERLIGIGIEQLKGSLLYELLDIKVVRRSRSIEIREISTLVKNIPQLQDQYRLKNYDESKRMVRVMHQSLFDEHKVLMGSVVTISDITDTVELKQQVSHQAHHDSLTMLPNRTLLLAKLDQMVESAQQTTSIFAVFNIVIDEFKKINDALGHRAGDSLLKLVTQRLQAIIGEQNVIARWSGDEFMVLFASAQDALQLVPNVAQDIIDSISHRFELDGQEIFVTASIGISLYPQDGQTGESVLSHAASAMGLAKQHGGNQFSFYLPDKVTDWTKDKLALEKDFRLALKNNELDVFFQPIINVQLRRVVRMEALVRWIHPIRGFLPPGDFVPMAEQIGLINQMGELVLYKACKLARELEKIAGPISISVNVAPRQLLQKGFIQIVETIINEVGLPAELLVLEITESAI
ncbi:MAG TPA: CHASE2 domain-containing protein, partial [Nitrosomonas sp.]|nr:CHASE2 domain-containing protein [Nitrosomonas sp.]